MNRGLIEPEGEVVVIPWYASGATPPPVRASPTRSRSSDEFIDHADSGNSTDEEYEISEDELSDEETQDKHEDEARPDMLDLSDTLLRFSKVMLDIPKKAVRKRREEKGGNLAVLFFLHRGLSLEQVLEWVEGELTRNRGLKVTTTINKGPRNFHVRFDTEKDRNSALSRIRLSYLRQEFIVLRWTPQAEHHAYIPAVYPVWVRFTDLDIVQTEWLEEIAGTLGPVLLPPHKVQKTSRPIYRVCIEWTHGTKILTEIPVRLGGVCSLVPIDITHLLHACFRCRRPGHVASKCPGDPLFPKNSSISAGTALPRITHGSTDPNSPTRTTRNADVTTGTRPLTEGRDPEHSPSPPKRGGDGGREYPGGLLDPSHLTRNTRPREGREMSGRNSKAARVQTGGGNRTISNSSRRDELAPPPPSPPPATSAPTDERRRAPPPDSDANTRFCRPPPPSAGGVEADRNGASTSRNGRSSTEAARAAPPTTTTTTTSHNKRPDETTEENNTATSPAPKTKKTRIKDESRQKKTELTDNLSGSKRKTPQEDPEEGKKSKLKNGAYLRRSLTQEPPGDGTSPQSFQDSPLIPKRLLGILSTPEDLQSEATTQHATGGQSGGMEMDLDTSTMLRETTPPNTPLGGGSDEGPDANGTENTDTTTAARLKGPKPQAGKKRETRAAKAKSSGEKSLDGCPIALSLRENMSPNNSVMTTDKSSLQRGQAASSEP